MGFKRSWLNGLFIERQFRLRHIVRLLMLSLFNVVISAVALTMFYQELMNVLLSVDSPFALMPDEMVDISIPGLHDILILWVGSLAGVVGLITLIGGFLITQKVIGPVYNLKQKLALVQAGDLTVDIKFRKGDEYQDLADSINQIVKDKRAVIRLLNEAVYDIETLDNLPADVREKFKKIYKTIDHYQF
ncbi:MAG: methyl-accepting chemotaxis protein [Mariprofundaceae bacterium]|nr:methyl-accepting chemotaxis protein [Mariprofundaceae bacterium]